MYIQFYEYLNKILSKWQCGFCQGYSAQHCLLVMVEKWRQCLDNGGVSRTLLTDLSKAFDYTLHDLLIAKPAAYGFKCCKCLQMLQSYLSNRKQRIKINDAYSKYCEILLGVPKGSILGPYFMTYFIDIFYDINDCDIASYADDNTPYASSTPSMELTLSR